MKKVNYKDKLMSLLTIKI